MNVAEKLNIVSENLPKVYNAGYEKGRNDNLSNKEEQEKTIEITKNGTTEILPDDGKVLSKVSVEVDVPSDDSLAIGLIQRDVTEIVIPDGVTTIGERTFSNCSSLTEIVIPDGVTTIGKYTFSNCSSLTEIVIPDGVTNLNNGTFEFCSALKSVLLPKNDELTILTTVFNTCTSLTNIIIPHGCKTLGWAAFNKCTALTTIWLPNTLTKVSFDSWDNAFSGCENLESVTLENGFNTRINLSSSTKYSVETIVSWGEALFDRTGLDSYILTIGSENIEKLSDEQIAIFTNKNWTLA